MPGWGFAARATDIFLIVLGAALAQMVIHHGSVQFAEIDRFVTAFDCALVLLLFPGFGLYGSNRGQPVSQLAWRVLAAWCTVTLVSVMMLFILHRAGVVSRLWLGTAAVLTGAALAAEKILAHIALKRLRRLGKNQKTIAIVGPERHSHEILAQIRRATYAGFKPLWLFDEGASEGRRVFGVEVMTRFNEFVERARRERIDEIWLALPLSEVQTIHRFTREFRHDFINLRFLPDVKSVSLFSHSVSEIIGLTSINVNMCPVQPFELWPKIVFDRLFAACVLIVLLPFLVFVGALVKLSSPGPALFRQKRMGVDGRQFEILKFRTMKVHAHEPGRLAQATRDDSRITPIGAFLRRTSLDEFPQFLNVLLGHMSVVGPRPHALEHDDLYKGLVDGYMYRYRIKPGITGWAQVNGYRGETRRVEKMEARVKFDLFYIQNWSFWFDMKIIVMTIFKGFSGRNAF